MPVYSETLSDADILEIIRKGKYKNVLLIGCGSCMNESLAYKNRLPLNVVEGGQHKNYALSKELDRIQDLIKLLDCKAYCSCVPEGGNAFCMIDSGRELFNFSEDETSHDAIFGLCCSSGIVGLKYKFKEIPVKLLTRTIGSLGYISETSLDGSKNMIFDKSKVIKFVVEK
jgi:hypothetical protein